jgi:hypothetical protein
MIGYKDKTWCNATECLNFEACDRALKPETVAAAIVWWGPNPPIVKFTAPKQLSCYVAPASAESQPKSES